MLYIIFLILRFPPSNVY